MATTYVKKKIGKPCSLAYSPEMFRIGMKKFRLNFRAENIMPKDAMPAMKGLCLFIEKMCGVLPSPGAVRMNIYRDYGKVHELLGFRQNDTNTGMIMMDDEEFIRTHYDKEIDLTAAEIKFLKDKNLFQDFFDMQVQAAPRTNATLGVIGRPPKRPYTSEQFSIVLKKFRQEIRDSGRNPIHSHPSVYRMSKFTAKLCNVPEITTGTIQKLIYKDFGYAHKILGLRKVKAGDPVKQNSQAWFLMDDKEYMQNYGADSIEMTQEELDYLAERGLDLDLVDLIDIIEPLASQELVPIESDLEDEEEEVFTPKVSTNVILDVPRSKSKINYNVLAISKNSTKSNRDKSTEDAVKVQNATPPPKKKKTVKVEIKYLDRPYTSSEFTIALKKYRLEIRASNEIPSEQSPVLKKMSKFLESLCDLQKVSSFAIRNQIFKDFGNAHLILGVRILKNEDGESNNWILMDDAEYDISTFDENFELTAEELKLVISRGLQTNFYEPIPPKALKPTVKTKKIGGRPKKKRYTAEQFAIVTKMFRKEMRSYHSMPNTPKNPCLSKMAKCLEKMCGITESDEKDRITSGAIKMMISNNFGNSQLIIGLRRARKGDDLKNAQQKWFMMDEEEFSKSYYDEDVDLSPDELVYLSDKGLAGYLNETTPKDPLTVDDSEILEESEEEQNHYGGSMDYSDDEDTKEFEPPNKRYKTESLDTPRSNPEIDEILLPVVKLHKHSFTPMVEQKLPKIFSVTGAASKSSMNSEEKDDKLKELVIKYESDPDWLFCRSLCATMKNFSPAVKNNLKFEMMELATKKMVDHLN